MILESTIAFLIGLPFIFAGWMTPANKENVWIPLFIIGLVFCFISISISMISVALMVDK